LQGGRHLARRLWLAADGTVKPFDGDMDDYAKFVLDRAKQAIAKPSQIKKEEAAAAPAAQNNKGKKNDRKSGPSPSTLRHAVKKAEERMAQLTAEIARIDDDMANASVSNPKALEGLTRARAKTRSNSLSGMPGPVSSMMKASFGRLSRPPARSMAMRTPPVSVNLTALPARLNRTCLSRPSSATMSGASCAIDQTISRPFS